jgi:uracil phosphoribosyltransferase
MEVQKQFKNLYVSTYPLILDKLAKLRNAQCPYFEFRRLLEEISVFLFYEASKELEMESDEIVTPLTKTKVSKLKREILLVPILRAGLGMLNGILKILPDSRVGMVGVYRDEDSLRPVDYYNNVPKNLKEFEIFLLDPMLATGGSAKFAIDSLKKVGAERTTMVSIIVAPEGVEHILKRFPALKIFTAALDQKLNTDAYIVPGLGDAGDRYFGT